MNHRVAARQSMIAFLSLLALTACARTPASVRYQEQRAPASPLAYAPLDDGQIAGIGASMDVQEIQTAGLVASRASKADVRAFAEEVLADHQRAQQAELALLRARGIELQPSFLSERFESSARDFRDWLSNENGPAFDRDLLTSEIKEEMRQINWLDHVLVPAVHDADLRAALLRRRVTATRLLDEARALVLRVP